MEQNEKIVYDENFLAIHKPFKKNVKRWRFCQFDKDHYELCLIFFQEKSQFIYDYFSKIEVSLRNKKIIVFCFPDLTP